MADQKYLEKFRRSVPARVASRVCSQLQPAHGPHWTRPAGRHFYKCFGQLKILQKSCFFLLTREPEVLALCLFYTITSVLSNAGE